MGYDTAVKGRGRGATHGRAHVKGTHTRTHYHCAHACRHQARVLPNLVHLSFVHPVTLLVLPVVTMPCHGSPVHTSPVNAPLVHATCVWTCATGTALFPSSLPRLVTISVAFPENCLQTSRHPVHYEEYAINRLTKLKM